MEMVGARDLKQHTGAVIARVRNGERLLLTVRGRPVAMITPIDQQALDALFAAARCHSSAGAYLARETPFEIMLLSMLVEQQKQLVALTRKVADLETRLPADPPARVAS